MNIRWSTAEYTLGESPFQWSNISTRILFSCIDYLMTMIFIVCEKSTLPMVPFA